MFYLTLDICTLTSVTIVSPTATASLTSFLSHHLLKGELLWHSHNNNNNTASSLFIVVQQPAAYLGHRLPRSAQQWSDPHPFWWGPWCLTVKSWTFVQGNQTELGWEKGAEIECYCFPTHSLLLRGGRGEGPGFIGISSQTLAPWLNPQHKHSVTHPS